MHVGDYFRCSCLYFTRKCFRKCEYCRIRDNSSGNKELDVKEWKEVVKILNYLGVEFNLILGNEPLARPEEFIELIPEFNKLESYAVYSSAGPELFDKYKYKMIDAGLKNFSTGMDFLDAEQGDIGKKSVDGLRNTLWMKEHGVPLTFCVTTISKLNLPYLEDIMHAVCSKGLVWALNVVHYDMDGGFDFFPPKEEIPDFVLTKEDVPLLKKQIAVMKKGIENGYRIQNTPLYFDYLENKGWDLRWHCKEPLLSMDADGKMRLCGYRKGEEVNKFSIFDLTNEKKLREFIDAWYVDNHVCCGCYWMYSFVAEEAYMKGTLAERVQRIEPH